MLKHCVFLILISPNFWKRVQIKSWFFPKKSLDFHPSKMYSFSREKMLKRIFTNIFDRRSNNTLPELFPPWSPDKVMIFHFCFPVVSRYSAIVIKLMHDVCLTRNFYLRFVNFFKFIVETKVVRVNSLRH